MDEREKVDAAPVHRVVRRGTWFVFKRATSPRWHLSLWKLRIQWWPREPWHRKLEIGWW